jgi:hypothetical protein
MSSEYNCVKKENKANVPKFNKYIPGFEEIRQENLNKAEKEYYTILDEYINLYQQYLNGDTSEGTMGKLKILNRELMTIAKKVQTDNKKTSNQIDFLFDKYQQKLQDTLIVQSSEMKGENLALKERNEENTNLKEMIFQMEKQMRRQRILFWIYVVFVVLLISCVGYLMTVVSNIKNSQL